MWKKQLFKKLLSVSAAIVLLAAGCNLTPKQNETVTAPETINVEANSQAPISYQGEEGKNALEVLKTKYEVQTEEYAGVGEFVKSINGNTPDDKHFWAFYVNGQTSNVGAGQYITKNTDTIEWKLEEIK